MPALDEHMLHDQMTAGSSQASAVAQESCSSFSSCNSFCISLHSVGSTVQKPCERIGLETSMILEIFHSSKATLALPLSEDSSAVTSEQEADTSDCLQIFFLLAATQALPLGECVDFAFGPPRGGSCSRRCTYELQGVLLAVAYSSRSPRSGQETACVYLRPNLLSCTLHLLL